MSDEFEQVRLVCSRSPDIRFEGRLIGEYSTQNKAQRKDRWTELRLWETPAGNWIAESVGVSRVRGELLQRDARAIIPGGAGEPGAIGEAMDLWGWSPAAKGLARQLGWDVIHRVP